MGLGEMLSRLFRKEGEKENKPIEKSGAVINEIEDKKKTEQDALQTASPAKVNAQEHPRTESIYKLQTRNIEEDASYSSEFDFRSEGMKSEDKDEKTMTDLGEPQKDFSLKPNEASPHAEHLTEGKVLQVLSDVYDPEIPIDIVNLGLIYGVDIQDGKVLLKMTMTAPACPASAQIAAESKMLIEEIPGVKEATIEIVWDPPWDPSKMSEEAKQSLGYV